MSIVSQSLQLDGDTQAVLLLCGYFSRRREDDVKPFSLAEYNSVASWLNQQGMRPADLLTHEGQGALKVWQDRQVSQERLQGLLGRGVALGFAVERWSSQGIWVISRSDPRYPKRLKERLRSRAPVLLYGVGNLELLGRGGLAIVGSRDADEAASLFTNILAERCSKEDITVISGDAKGVDREAMTTALDAGGTVIGVLPEGVAKPSVKRDYRKPIQEGRLALVSVLYPDAPWSAPNAMGRNRYIYTLSDYACVVASATDGGTWTGATENLKHGWVKLFVRNDEAMPAGNKALLERGGVPFGSEDLKLGASLGDRFVSKEATPLFQKPSAPSSALGGLEFEASSKPSDNGARPDVDDLFDVIWPHVARALQQPQTPAELSGLFNVQKSQMDAWLQRATKEKDVKKLVRPVRYVINRQKALPL